MEAMVTHSAGAVIASEVVVRGASINEASSKFNSLARQIFPLRPRRYTFLGQSWDLLSTWMMDSRYDSDNLDRALQEAFGPTRRLFDTTAPLVSGIRVALTASQVTDGSLCLFPNYRAAGRSNMQSAHSILTSNDEPLLWEVSVATLPPHPTSFLCLPPTPLFKVFLRILLTTNTMQCAMQRGCPRVCIHPTRQLGHIKS